MRFLVVEKPRAGVDPSQMMKIAADDVQYSLKLQKQKKVIGGGPFLDIIGDGYILETNTIEEMAEVFFNSPSNVYVDREVHPLGTYEDTLEGLREMGLAPKRRGRPPKAAEQPAELVATPTKRRRGRPPKRAT